MEVLIDSNILIRLRELNCVDFARYAEVSVIDPMTFQ